MFNLLFLVFGLFFFSNDAYTKVNNEDIAKKSQRFNFLKGEKTFIRNPFKLRDPFKRPRLKKRRKAGELIKERNTFSNIGTTEGIPLSKIIIVGVIIGRDRRAIAKIEGGSGKTYILKEGMTLGENGAVIKAILPGGLVLVEKMRNIYEQEEYLETIIPISTQ